MGMDASAKTYHAANASFALIILLVLGYSLAFRAGQHPIPSVITQVTGEATPSKGLSASFSEIVRGNLAGANSANPYGIRIFLFFAIQLALRISVSLIVQTGRIRIGVLVLVDASVSGALFLWSFAPLIGYTLWAAIRVAS